LIKVLISLGTVWFGGWVLGDWYVLVWIRGLVARWDTYYQQGFIIDWLEVGSIILLRLGAPYKMGNIHAGYIKLCVDLHQRDPLCGGRRSGNSPGKLLIWSQTIPGIIYILSLGIWTLSRALDILSAWSQTKNPSRILGALTRVFCHGTDCLVPDQVPQECTGGPRSRLGS
jgi:hypothetical protein